MNLLLAKWAGGLLVAAFALMPTVGLTAEVVADENSLETQHVPAPQVEPAESETGPYDPRLAQGASMLATLGGVGLAVLTMGGSAIAFSQDEPSVANGLLWGALGVVGVSLIIGPAAGHFYADVDQQAWVGLGIRGGTAILAGIPLAIYLGKKYGDDEEQESEGQPPVYDYGQSFSFIATVVITGVCAPLVLLTSGIYDIVVAPRSARRANARIAPTAPTVSLVPLVFSNPNSSGVFSGAGLGISTRL